MKTLFGWLVAVGTAIMSTLAWAEDAYLESKASDKIGINSGYFINAKTKIEIDFQLTEVVAQARLFGQNGAESSTCKNYAVVYFGDTANNIKFGYGAGKFNGVYLAPNNLVRNTVVYDGPANKGYLYQDGVQKASANLTAAHDATAGFPMAIFAESKNAYGSDMQNYASMKLYGLKVYEKNESTGDYELVRDFVPCVKGDVAGLYEKVEGKFRTNERIGALDKAFTAGGDNLMTLPADPYVETDGVHALNTKVFVMPNLSVDVDYQFASVDDPTPEKDSHYQQRIVGMDSTTPCIAAYINKSKNIALALGQEFGAHSTGLAADLYRHRVVLEEKSYNKVYMTGFTTNNMGQGTCKRVTKTGSRPIALAGDTTNDAGTGFSNCAKIRIFEAKFFVRNQLIRHYVPRIQGGVAGLRDLVSGDFITCEGLTSGGDEAQLNQEDVVRQGDAYIESNGSFFSTVNFNYFPSYKTKAEVDFQMVTLETDKVPFGTYGSDFSMLLYCEGARCFQLSACDGTYSAMPFDSKPPFDLARHTAVIDTPGRTIKLLAPDGKVEGERTMDAAKTYTKKSKWPFLLFGDGKDVYGHSQKLGKLRIYGAKFWEKGNEDADYTLVHDLTPVVQDGIPGFKDRVTGNFYAGEGLTASASVPAEQGDLYVENPAGGCFFDTGYYPKTNTSIWLDFMPLVQQTGQQFPYEAGASDQSGNMFVRVYGNGSAGTGDWAHAYGIDTFKTSFAPYVPKMRVQTFQDIDNHIFTVSSYGHLIGSTNIASWACSGVTKQASATLKLFASSGLNSNSAKGRLYGLKIYEGGKLVKDYEPVMAAGSYALREKVGGTLLQKVSNSNEFTGSASLADLRTFCTEPMRDEDAYIQSDATQGINLNYFPGPTSRFEIDYQLTAIRGQNRPFGVAGGGTGAELYIQGENVGSGKVAFGAGDTWTGQYTELNSDLKRHLAVLDLHNHEWAYTGKGFGKITQAIKNTSTFPLGLFAKSTAADCWSATTAKHKTAMKLYAFRIYENNALVHQYLPYKKGEVVGVYDTVTGDVLGNSIAGGNAFVYGTGRGYGKYAGEPCGIVDATAAVQIPYGKTKTISVFAPGAVRYRWAANGETIGEVEGETYDAPWQRIRTADRTVIYTVTPIYLKNGEEVEGEAKEIPATMRPAGLSLLVR